MDKGNNPAKLYFEHYVPNNCNPALHPIIFVHGICDSSKTWSKIFKKIADKTKRPAYAVDLRNHGKSEWNDSLVVEYVCLDVEHFIVENKIEKCIFVSHSFGSRICMNICLRKPKLVEKIVIEESPLENVTPKELETFSSLIALIRMMKFMPKTMKERELRTFMAKRAKEIYPDNPDVLIAVYCMEGYQDPDGTFHLSFNSQALERSIKDKSLAVIDFTDLQPYTGPALIIYGGKSGMAIEKDKLLPQYFPKAEFYKFENGSHYVHRECAEEFTTKVSDFINN